MGGAWLLAPWKYLAWDALYIFHDFSKSYQKILYLHNFFWAWKLHYKIQWLFQVFHDRTNLVFTPLLSKKAMYRTMSYHQLWEHAIQLIISWHRQCRLHGLQGKVLPQPVGDLWVIAAVKTAEDEGEAAAAATATFPRGHGSLMCVAGQVGRGGGLLQALFTASTTSEFGLRQGLLWTREKNAISSKHQATHSQVKFAL